MRQVYVLRLFGSVLIAGGMLALTVAIVFHLRSKLPNPWKLSFSWTTNDTYQVLPAVDGRVVIAVAAAAILAGALLWGLSFANAGR